MIYTVEINDEETQAKCRELAEREVEKGIAEAVKSWKLSQTIRELSEALVNSELEQIIKEKYAGNTKELEKKVGEVMNSIIKAKVKKAMK